MVNGLDSLNWEEAYRSSQHRIGADFYGHVLPLARFYTRAVGFFSSSVFRVAPEAFFRFFEQGGQMKLVCSPFLAKADIQALFAGACQRPAVRKLYTWDKLRREALDGTGIFPSLVAYLVAQDLLRVSIARVIDLNREHLYHEKIGCFEDHLNHCLAFSGSANESMPGLHNNFERIEVYASWDEKSERRRALRIQRDLQALWNNQTPGVEVLDILEAGRRHLLRPSDEEPSPNPKLLPPLQTPIQETLAQIPPEILQPPIDLKLRDHQRAAIQAWKNAQGRGLLEMATGSGKTLTALFLASKIYDAYPQSLAILIVAPQIHLVDQWCEIAKRFGLNPIRCAESKQSWYGELSAAIYTLNYMGRPVLSIVTTSATLASAPFQELLSRIRHPLLLIADEAHNYGAPNLINALPARSQLRLGLSATPDRWMDEEGSDALKAYFGDVVFSYTLAEAIHDGILTPYKYYPHLVELNDEEMERYIDITRRLRRYFPEDGQPTASFSDAAKRLLIERSRILGSAAKKIPLLRAILAKRCEDRHILIYCGDGQVEGTDSEVTLRQVDAVVQVLQRDLHMRCASYTAQTPPAQRREILESFSQGHIQALIAIRCLDEGVDIPATRTAFLLASSTNPRQFVQRRGRVLRRAPGKEYAELIDMIVTPSLHQLDPNTPEYKAAQSMIKQQIRRVSEFADLALNGPVARSQIVDITNHLNILDAWGSL